MELDALHSALLSLTLLPEKLRSAREDLARPVTGARTPASQSLEGIERDLRIAKASLARELGFPLCRCCWPPELLVAESDGNLGCATKPRVGVVVGVAAHTNGCSPAGNSQQAG